MPKIVSREGWIPEIVASAKIGTNSFDQRSIVFRM